MLVETGAPLTVGGLNFHALAAAITCGPSPFSSAANLAGVTFPSGSMMMLKTTKAPAGASGTGGIARLVGFRPPSTLYSGTTIPFRTGRVKGWYSPDVISVTTGLRGGIGGRGWGLLA